MWDQHCADKARLEEYASAMHMLAVNHWTKQAPEGRVEWCYQTATEFFRGGGLRKLMEKQKRKQQFHEDLKECCCCFATDNADRCSVSMLVNLCCFLGSLGKISLVHLIDMIYFRQIFCLKGLNFQRNDDFFVCFLQNGDLFCINS